MGLTVPLKRAPYSPHLLVFFVVVWHVPAYQGLSQCATPVSALGRRVARGRGHRAFRGAGANTPNQRKIRSRGRPGSLWGQPNENREL